VVFRQLPDLGNERNGFPLEQPRAEQQRTARRHIRLWQLPAIYNMRTFYSGSPFHTGNYSGPTGSACDYILSFPDDEKVLGVNDYVIATLGNLNNDPTYQREQAAFWVCMTLASPPCTAAM